MLTALSEIVSHGERSSAAAQITERCSWRSGAFLRKQRILRASIAAAEALDLTRFKFCERLNKDILKSDNAPNYARIIAGCPAKGKNKMEQRRRAFACHLMRNGYPIDKRDENYDRQTPVGHAFTTGNFDVGFLMLDGDPEAGLEHAEARPEYLAAVINAPLNKISMGAVSHVVSLLEEKKLLGAETLHRAFYQLARQAISKEADNYRDLFVCILKLLEEKGFMLPFGGFKFDEQAARVAQKLREGSSLQEERAWILKKASQQDSAGIPSSKSAAVIVSPPGTLEIKEMLAQEALQREFYQIARGVVDITDEWSRRCSSSAYNLLVRKGLQLPLGGSEIIAFQVAQKIAKRESLNIQERDWAIRMYRNLAKTGPSQSANL